MAPRRSSRLRGNESAQIEEVVCITEDTQETNRTSTRQKRKRTSKHTNSRRKSSKQARPAPSVARRPVVINLDVTYSESSDENDVEDITVLEPSDQLVDSTNTTNKKRKRKPKSIVTKDIVEPTPHIKDNRCSISDSDEEIVPDFCPNNSSQQKTDNNRDLSSESDSETEIYKVNYKAERWKVFEEVENEMKSMATTTGKGDHPVKKKDKKPKSVLADVDSTPSKDIDDSFGENLDSSMNSSLDLNIDVSSIVLKGSAKRVGHTNKKAKTALASLQAFTKRLQEDTENNSNAYNDSYYDDDVIIAEDSKISVRVDWGTSYTRHVLNKNSKFSSLYQEIADKHQVSVSQVVLSFKDNVVSPESRPRDINLSIGDIMEGGILLNSDQNSSSESTGRKKEGEISLKVQTSNRKIVHSVAMSKYDKMSVLMEKYSKLRNIPLNKLKFKFDGETLERSDTPSSLDLEGDECVDVFEL